MLTLLSRQMLPPTVEYWNGNAFVFHCAIESHGMRLCGTERDEWKRWKTAKTSALFCSVWSAVSLTPWVPVCVVCREWSWDLALCLGYFLVLMSRIACWFRKNSAASSDSISLIVPDPARGKWEARPRERNRARNLSFLQESKDKVRDVKNVNRCHVRFHKISDRCALVLCGFGELKIRQFK